MVRTCGVSFASCPGFDASESVAAASFAASSDVSLDCVDVAAHGDDEEGVVGDVVVGAVAAADPFVVVVAVVVTFDHVALVAAVFVSVFAAT